MLGTHNLSGSCQLLRGAVYEGWNVKHYYAWYRRAGGGRSYNWVRNCSKTAHFYLLLTKTVRRWFVDRDLW